MRTLREHRDIYAVTVLSRDDGFRGAVAHFMEEERAVEYARELSAKDLLGEPCVVQVSLWKESESGRYYQITMTPIEVNRTLIEQRALAKLTDVEKRVLGLVR